MTYMKSGASFVCILGAGSCGPRCGMLFATEAGIIAHQRRNTHNSLNLI